MINFFKPDKILELNKILIQKFFINNSINKNYLYHLGYNDELKKHFSYSIINMKNEINLQDSQFISGKINENEKYIYFTITIETKNQITIDYFSDFPLDCYQYLNDIQIIQHKIKLTKHPEQINIRYLTTYNKEHIVYYTVPHLISISTQVDINDFITKFLLIDENLNIYKIKQVLIKKQAQEATSYYISYLNANHISIQELYNIVSFINFDNLTQLTSANDLFNLLEKIQQKNKYTKMYKSL